MVGAKPEARTRQEELALALARDELRAADPAEVAHKAGVSYSAQAEGTGGFRVGCLGRIVQVTYPEGLVFFSDKPSSPNRAVCLIVLHYLTHADGHPLADRWVAFRELPNGLIYDKAFRGRVEPPLLAAFAGKPERFSSAARALGGRPLTFGDAAFMFHALPRLPMAIILHLGDEELPATVSVLFDGAAGHYLPTEDLAVLGGMLVGVLAKPAST
jgi:hypothetical protein